ncbi:AAA family ATPase [Actinomadura madurae]|uniref:AAA family ATPase n=1 Tax=Actinomadura madurae TaxID=1993 RepID=UPI0035583CC3
MAHERAHERLHERPHDRLHGRERELQAIEVMLDRARDGHGGALAITGDAGIGRTALLEAAVGRGTVPKATARTPGSRKGKAFRVLGTTGVPGETAVPYAGLHRLLRPLAGRGRAAAARRTGTPSRRSWTARRAPSRSSCSRRCASCWAGPPGTGPCCAGRTTCSGSTRARWRCWRSPPAASRTSRWRCCSPSATAAGTPAGSPASTGSGSRRWTRTPAAACYGTRSATPSTGPSTARRAATSPRRSSTWPAGGPPRSATSPPR